MRRQAVPSKSNGAADVAIARVSIKPREPRGRTTRAVPAGGPRPVKIFVSHSTKYRDLAKGLGSALKSLQFQVPIDVLLCEEMQGGTEWLMWINRELKSADILLLLYPHQNMDMAWCSYEKGRFDRDDDGKRAVLCIKNVDIAKPPPVFEQYQAYDADVAGIRRFLTELFARGEFTDGRPITAEVDQVSSEYCKRADAAANDLAVAFAKTRVKDLLFERRIWILLNGDDDGPNALDAATVEGNDGALSLFDVAPQANVTWQVLRERAGTEMEWMRDLDRALPSIRSGLLPPPLSPFHGNDGKIYLPVIPRTEFVAQRVRRIVVIFVEADGDKLRRMLDWLPPAAMPDSWIGLVRMVKLLVRLRWEVLEPQFQEAKFHFPDAKRCAELMDNVLTGIERVSADAKAQGLNGLAKFRSLFAGSLVPELDAATDEYQGALQELRSGVPANANELASRLARMLANNATWLQIGSKQFSSLTADLGGSIPTTRSS